MSGARSSYPEAKPRGRKSFAARAGERRCARLIVFDSSSGRRLLEPRQCIRATVPGLDVCALHAAVLARRPRVGVNKNAAAWCVGCAQLATVYTIGGTDIALCQTCGGAIARAIVEGR